MADLKKTPLYETYARYGAKTIDFGGWDLPIQFAGIQKEHEAVRTQAGLFDVSHMGEVVVRGPDALAFIQRLTTNDASRLIPGQAQYSLMCYPDGGVVDDLLVYRLDEQQFMLVINASNIEKDAAWLHQHLAGQVELEDVSEATALLALQGPRAEELLQPLCSAALLGLQPFQFVQQATVGGIPVQVLSRTGYTGEDGFELYVHAHDAVALWTALLSYGEEKGLVPAGLGARDTLRFEARLPLYGQELSEHITPIEAGLGFFVKPDKGEFIGKEVLVQQKTEGAPRRLAGIQMVERGIPRAHYAVYDSRGAWIGEVTTGTQSPTFKTNIGLALLKREYSVPGTEVWVDIRGKKVKAAVVKTPFYRRGGS
ncbi:glycine cleavage system aminomethyltransferase GcvT [Paenibacillus sp. y28]|uniref:glycine cleavage system aminomethyltransferase GcvT n=1 Tax=Paenibacillus sp. y28 TaxID=3129110 RepID=UPI003016D88C